jgi:5-(carboxyamino)imidazole ribonucleotide mutase
MRVAVLMGSEKDLPAMQPCIDVLTGFGVEHEVHVMSAHRTPDRVAEFARGARRAGFGAIVCGAGKAAHLAGAVAAQTTLPVIGVPIAAGALGGLDALLSTVQMPTGIPVATVAVDGAANAGYLAIAVLATGDGELEAALDGYREGLRR